MNALRLLRAFFLGVPRELLYYCPLISLPFHIQDQFELEADIFAAEAFFWRAF